VSLENLSTISPSGVNEFDDFEDPFFLAAASDHHPKSAMGAFGAKFLGAAVDALDAADDKEEGEDAAAAFEEPSANPPPPSTSSYVPMGEDPLEWLLENDSSMQHLPESSLRAPMFPDFADLSSGALYPQEGMMTGDVAFPSSSSSSTAGGTVRPLQPQPGSGARRSAASSGSRRRMVDVTDNLPYADPKVTVQSLFLVANDEEEDQGYSMDEDMGPALLLR
jgi:hypothetical protein